MQHLYQKTSVNKKPCIGREAERREVNYVMFSLRGYTVFVIRAIVWVLHQYWLLILEASADEILKGGTNGIMLADRCDVSPALHSPRPQSLINSTKSSSSLFGSVFY